MFLDNGCSSWQVEVRLMSFLLLVPLGGSSRGREPDQLERGHKYVCRYECSISCYNMQAPPPPTTHSQPNPHSLSHLTITNQHLHSTSMHCTYVCTFVGRYHHHGNIRCTLLTLVYLKLSFFPMTFGSKATIFLSMSSLLPAFCISVSLTEQQNHQ